MGDYAAATLTLYGLSGKEQQVLEVLESGWSVEWDGKAVELADMRDGVELTDSDCSVGWTFDGCGTQLIEVGISYRFCQCAKYEYDGTLELFTPELGVFQTPASQEGSALAFARDLDLALAMATSLEELREKLGELTGRRWRDALALLEAVNVDTDTAT